MGKLTQHFVDWIYRRYFAPRVDRQIYEHLLMRPHIFGGDENRVRIAPTALVGNALFNIVAGEIKIGEYAFFGHNVCLLTGTHDVRLRGYDRQQNWALDGRGITIEDGVWLGSNVTVIGPVTIGKDSVVAAGAVVTKDIPSAVLAAGVPAKIVRKLDEGELASHKSPKTYS